MKKILKVLLIVLIVIAVAFAGYFAYLMVQYSRIEDKLPLEVAQNASGSVNVGEEYSIVTWNLGFGAYSDDYSFFMDGGTESRARSKEAVIKNISGKLVVATGKRIGNTANSTFVWHTSSPFAYPLLREHFSASIANTSISTCRASGA